LIFLLKSMPSPFFGTIKFDLYENPGAGWGLCFAASLVGSAKQQPERAASFHDIGVSFATPGSSYVQYFGTQRKAAARPVRRQRSRST
jgi:hypothetical protein